MVAFLLSAIAREFEVKLGVFTFEDDPVTLNFKWWDWCHAY